jgi:hypothetical protein
LLNKAEGALLHIGSNFAEWRLKAANLLKRVGEIENGQTPSQAKLEFALLSSLYSLYFDQPAVMRACQERQQQIVDEGVLELSNPKMMAEVGIALQLQQLHSEGIMPGGEGNHLKAAPLKACSKGMVHSSKLMKKAASLFSVDDPRKVLWEAHVFHAHCAACTFYFDPGEWGCITPYEYISPVMRRYDFDTHHPLASRMGTSMDLMLMPHSNPLGYGLARCAPTCNDLQCAS